MWSRSPDIIRAVVSRNIKMAEHVTRWKDRCIEDFLRKSEGKRLFGRRSRRGDIPVK